MKVRHSIGLKTAGKGIVDKPPSHEIPSPRESH